LLLGVVVTSVGVQDRDGAVELLADRFLDFWRLEPVWKLRAGLRQGILAVAKAASSEHPQSGL
jgi:hypothetical protein